MTIRRLAEYLREQQIPKIGRRNDEDQVLPFYLNRLKGKKVAIEAAGLIYRQNWAAVKHVMKNYTFIYVQNKNGIGGHWTRPADDEIYTMFKVYFASFVRRILETGVIPVFVIEGKAPEMKGATIAKRMETRSDLEYKADSLKGDIDLSRFKKKLVYSYPPGYKHIEIVLDILHEKGISTVRARHEAEGVCAYLVNTEYVLDASGTRQKFPLHCDVALSDDYDIIGLYGCKAVIRNLRAADSTKGYFEAEGYAFDDILYTLGFLPLDAEGNRISVSEADRDIAENRFRLMCILCGTDYADNVRGLGPAKICTLMKKHNIYTYEDACKVEPRFSEIPYDEIIKTLNSNKEFSVVNYESSTPKREAPQIE